MKNRYFFTIANIVLLLCTASCTTAQTHVSSNSDQVIKPHSKPHIQASNVVENARTDKIIQAVEPTLAIEIESKALTTPNIYIDEPITVSEKPIAPRQINTPIIVTPNPITANTNSEIGLVPSGGSVEIAINEPVGISDQYTGYDGPVPLIIDPKTCGKNKYEIIVDVDNIPNNKGFINADLHDDNRENFLVGEKAIVRVRATAHKGRASFCIPLTKPGEYSVAIYHDKNDNLKFDKNFLGIPKERFGMSNNPKFGTRAPNYEEAVFMVPDTGANIRIKLRKASDILGSQK